VVAVVAVPGLAQALPRLAPVPAAPRFVEPDAEQPVLEAARREPPLGAGPLREVPGPELVPVLVRGPEPGRPAVRPAQPAGLRGSDRSRPAAR